MVVEQRRHYRRFDVPIDPAFGIDLGSVRFLREEEYVQRLAGLTSEFVEDVCPSQALSPALLLLDGERVLPEGVPPNADEASVDQADFHMPSDWRLWERQTRHRYDVLVSVQSREVFSFNQRGHSSRFAELPWWWQDVEVSFGLVVEAPEVLSYKGVHLKTNPSSSLWKVFRAEHAANCAAAVLYAARQGRVWWLPREVRQDVYDLLRASVKRRQKIHGRCSARSS